jgi:hypothetical protein
VSGATIEVEKNSRRRIGVSSREDGATRQSLVAVGGDLDLDTAGVELSTAGRILGEQSVTLMKGDDLGCYTLSKRALQTQTMLTYSEGCNRRQGRQE